MEMEPDALIVVTGAGGFIGGHLISNLHAFGYKNVRAVDIKPFSNWYQYHEDVENLQLDLREKADAEKACKDGTYIFNLAADMGGMGFIENNKAACMLSVLINTHMLLAAKKYQVQRFLFSSSACVYAENRQRNVQVIPLKEEHAYPAMPEDGYGWEKLFSERMCRHFSEEYQLPTRIVRYHNVYGPHGTYDGGREKSPAALCRKIIQAQFDNHHEIEIWGDGEQTRSFTYIDDCIYGTKAIMTHPHLEVPINLGSSELVSINQLVDIIEEIACTTLKRTYNLNAPLGVRGRNSDNTLINSTLGWEPSTSLKIGLENTYRWIYDQMAATHHSRPLRRLGLGPTKTAEFSLASMLGQGPTYIFIRGNKVMQEIQKKSSVMHVPLKTMEINTVLGPMMAIGDDEALYLLEFVTKKSFVRELDRLQKRGFAITPGESAALQSIAAELNAYFAGQLMHFKTPYRPLGTAFQQQVWNALCQIPYGETRSYAEQALAINKPTAYRAVANANGANQLAIIIPCHRIISSDGSLGGYGGGVSVKQWLLEHEQRHKLW